MPLTQPWYFVIYGIVLNIDTMGMRLTLNCLIAQRFLFFK